MLDIKETRVEVLGLDMKNNTVAVGMSLELQEAAKLYYSLKDHYND